MGRMLHRRRIVWLVVVACLFIAGSVWAALKTGSTAPDFSAKDLNGKTVKLSQFRGKPLVLYFWATWCPPCRRASPEINSIFNTYKSKGLVVLAPNEEADVAKVRRYVKDHKLSYTVLPNAGAVNRHYGVRGFPTIVYIDKQGKIAGNDLGFPGRAAVEEKVRKILR